MYYLTVIISLAQKLLQCEEVVTVRGGHLAFDLCDFTKENMYRIEWHSPLASITNT